MTLCHRNDKEHKFPNFERNWCWVGFKEQCHQNRPGRERSWADIQDAAYRDGRVPPVDQAPFDPLLNPGLCDRPSLGAVRNWTQSEWLEARTWFKRYVRVYVLNLPGDVARWSKMSQRLDELQIDALRVGSVDMRQPDTMAQAMIAGWIPSGFNFSHAKTAAEHARHDHDLNGTLGFAAGHFRAQARSIDDGATLGLILQDNAWLERDFVPRLWNLVSKELPCDWEVVSLFSRCGYGRCVSPHLARVEPDGNEKEQDCRHGVNLGMQAMLYRSQSLGLLQAKWQRVVFNEDRPYCFDVDAALSSISDRVAYYSVPSSQAPGFLRELDSS
jgi:hypothetical protein